MCTNETTIACVHVRACVCVCACVRACTCAHNTNQRGVWRDTCLESHPMEVRGYKEAGETLPGLRLVTLLLVSWPQTSFYSSSMTVPAAAAPAPMCGVHVNILMRCHKSEVFTARATPAHSAMDSSPRRGSDWLLTSPSS